MFWSRSKKKCKKSWTQFSAAWKTERQREQEEMERRKKRRAIVRKGSHSGEVLNVPPGKGTIDSLCPIWASVSKQRCCIHLTQKNLLSNFVWDEVTANCKFSHAVENHPAQTRQRWRNNKGWAHAFFPQTTAHHASPFLSPPSCYFYIPSSAQWLPFLPSFSLFPPWLPPNFFFLPTIYPSLPPHLSTVVALVTIQRDFLHSSVTVATLGFPPGCCWKCTSFRSTPGGLYWPRSERGYPLVGNRLNVDAAYQGQLGAFVVVKLQCFASLQHLKP